MTANALYVDKPITTGIFIVKYDAIKYNVLLIMQMLQQFVAFCH